MGFKKTDGLMRHLRENGIQIQGRKDKRDLINFGYYHGYKGYRFFQNSSRKLPFTSFSEITATVKFDSELKSLFYEKIMFIETAIKNIALEQILLACNSEKISVMFEEVIKGYNNGNASLDSKAKRERQASKLFFQKNIQGKIADAYKRKNPIITHFYDKGDSEVPLWALFEILMLGDFANLLSHLVISVREDISNAVGLNLRFDSDRQLVYKYMYCLKDLRNAIAHNGVIFDARFRTNEPSHAMKDTLKTELGLSFVNFHNIDDYFFLVCYLLKVLGATKSELKKFIKNYERVTTDYISAVDSSVSSIVVRNDQSKRIAALKQYIA